MIAHPVKYITFPMAIVKLLSFLQFSMLVMLTGFLTMAGAILLPACPAWSATIVLDPGHGGNDGGAGSSSEYAEKQFTLALAQKIAGHLAAKHRVELTRTADINMAPADRAAVANHLQADLMISLHAAVAPYCSNRAAIVYYHNDERLTIPPELAIPGTPDGPNPDRPAWDRLQIRHQHQSQALAAALKTALTGTAVFERVTVYGVPLVALMGADLPAVLVEVGCFHPTATPDVRAREQLLNDFAESIAKAIETALPGLAR